MSWLKRDEIPKENIGKPCKIKRQVYQQYRKEVLLNAIYIGVDKDDNRPTVMFPNNAPAGTWLPNGEHYRYIINRQNICNTIRDLGFDPNNTFCWNIERFDEVCFGMSKDDAIMDFIKDPKNSFAIETLVEVASR